jgi:peptidoglycan/xylan/chitin deacetylase (PgdA/CDA1 family)
MPSTATTVVGRCIDELGNILLQPPLGGVGQVLCHGDRARKTIAITFDDGPNEPSTSDVLDVLAAYKVKATFFCVGVNALRFPHLVGRAVAEGHVIGNHSMHHSRKAGLLPGAGQHIDACTQVLKDILGRTPCLYRAPWGWLAPWEVYRLRRRGFAIVGWDVYTYDWQVPPPPADEIVAGVVRDIHSGSIVLFHDGVAGIGAVEKPQTVRAVEQTIVQLRAAGFTFVSIPELLNILPYQHDGSGGDATCGGL